jgi:hypothetical protein
VRRIKMGAIVGYQIERPFISISGDRDVAIWSHHIQDETIKDFKPRFASNAWSTILKDTLEEALIEVISISHSVVTDAEINQYHLVDTGISYEVYRREHIPTLDHKEIYPGATYCATITRLDFEEN